MIAKRYTEKQIIALLGEGEAGALRHPLRAGGEELQVWLEKCGEPAAAANVVGFLNCQGELAEPVADILKQSADPNIVEYGESRSLTLGQPDEARLERARAFARQVMGSKF